MTVGGGQRKTLSACCTHHTNGSERPIVGYYVGQHGVLFCGLGPNIGVEFRAHDAWPVAAADDSWAAGTIRPAVCIGQGSWGVRVLFSITHRDGLFRIRITPRSAASSRATHIDRPRDKQTHFSKSQTKYQRLLDGEGPSKNYLAESESWTLAFENLHDGNKRKSL
ncbi:predicted protein [Histoplasma capsulatum H143]|uniref:Uncharacterized protein n=1 Tax=Ajellomyces capsulatus (strain H143) TaxID=544712 RepID=C6HF50_AJECH|nr:predicted protein [Histoplasma capsulatum H143]